MKKIEVGPLKTMNKDEEGAFLFLKKLNFEKISKLSVSPETINNNKWTLFTFKTETDETIKFFYEANQKIWMIRIWTEKYYIGDVTLDQFEKNEKKEQWLNHIWNQFIDYFHLRIRLLFINETTPWKWKTEFIY